VMTTKAKRKRKATSVPIVLIDTCVWLDLAKDHHQKALLQAMETLVERSELRLFVPRTVLEELERNKARIVVESGRTLVAALKRAREVVARFGHRRRKRSALREIDEIDHKLLNLGDDAAEMLVRVEDLLKKAVVIEISDALKLRAANRAIEKKAPFHRQRNGMADAIIIEAYAGLVGGAAADQQTAFVTHNAKDFSHPTDNNQLPHPDLADLFANGRSHYFITLGEALRMLGGEEFADLMIEDEWLNQPARRLKEIIDAEDEFHTKVWYNRHMTLREEVEDGKVKIVEQGGDYFQNTVQRDVWGANAESW
jgi:PIN domain